MMNSPKIVEHHVNMIIMGLEESFFFSDYEISDEYSRKVFTKLVTEKYIEDPSLENLVFWSEDEFQRILEKIITGSIMYSLKKEGIMGSYEDDQTEETFFLTEKGKEISKTLIKE
jgi:hypothetical protein